MGRQKQLFAKICTSEVVRFRIGKKIANGAFGQLRVVKDLATGEVSQLREEEKMLENRPEDALVLLVETVEIV